ESLDSTGGWLSASRFKRCAYSMNSGAYKLSGAPLVDAQVSWGVESLSISTKSPVERTDAHGKATCTAVNNARPGEQGVGHVTAQVLSGADTVSVKTVFLTFKLPKK
ncbi:hypothetical protein, partial [Pseudomonas sp. FSL R10-2398]|uniref:hypothetical protein n=1 Tax=Pseudomonas sp. FSL R10-2398 TaxID=2662201 RepID=UPI001C49C9A9